MKKKKNEFNEQVMTAIKKVHGLINELLDADVRPEVISTVLAQELTSSVAAIASLKEDESSEEKFAFIDQFFEMLAKIARENCKEIEAIEEAEHGDN